MNKAIRPLSKWKKENEDRWMFLYMPLIKESIPESKKSIENEFYFVHCIFTLETDFKTKREQDSFYYTPKGNLTNKVLVSEIGRLLLYGWYYNIEEWTKEIGLSVYKGYKEREKNKEHLDKKEISIKIKHIRDNIGYYYHNTSEVNILLAYFC